MPAEGTFLAHFELRSSGNEPRFAIREPFAPSLPAPQCPCSSRYFSVSSAAMHPEPAAVIACR